MVGPAYVAGPHEYDPDQDGDAVAFGQTLSERVGSAGGQDACVATGTRFGDCLALRLARGSDRRALTMQGGFRFGPGASLWGIDDMV